MMRPLSGLFLCTGNSARSILAEACLNARGGGRFFAYSAGNQPAGRVNPFALALLETLRIDAGNARSKSWDEFARPGAPQVDIVITVCDNAAGEVCPVWPGQPVSAHWGVDDPAAVAGADDLKRKAFLKAFAERGARIDRLVALPVETLAPQALKRELAVIGKVSLA